MKNSKNDIIMKRFYDRAMTAAMVGCVLFATGMTFTSSAIAVACAAVAALCGKKLDSYKADVDTDANFEKDTEVIKDGVFYESEKRSAPYFDIRIDGINLLDEAY